MEGGEGTKVFYYIDDEETPYLVKLTPANPGTEVTLSDLKKALNKPHYKYFFKSEDQDFGIVKEEIIHDENPLPSFNGKIVCWLEMSQGSQVGAANNININNDSESSISSTLPPPGIERGAGVGETRPPSFHGVANPSETDKETDDVFDDTESSITSVSQAAAERRRMELRMRMHGRKSRLPALPGPGIPRPGHGGASASAAPTSTDATSSMMSSELESSIYDDTESMASSRFTTSTDHTSVSQQMLKNRQKRRSKRRPAGHNMNRAGSMSSVTDSTMSLNCMTVTLNMDTVNFLGISIVGQSNKFGDGDCGIYVGSIMKGGAVALDGRIEPGDMILQVNEISFENMSNDDAVRVLREVVQKPGPIKLVIAKCWDPAPSKSYFTIPSKEPVRPIDPRAWVAHTAAVREFENPMPPPSFVDGPYAEQEQPYSSQDPLLGDFLPGGHMHMPPASHFGPQAHHLGDYPGRCQSVTTLSGSSISSRADTEKFVPYHGQQAKQDGGQPAPPPGPLTTSSGMGEVVRAMQRPDSGLEVRERLWLKIKIPNAFIGSDVVDWLHKNVNGFSDRREAKKYASQMADNGFIKHGVVNKKIFSEQCYYTFKETNNPPAPQQQQLQQQQPPVNMMANLALQDNKGVSLPPPTVPAPPIPQEAGAGASWAPAPTWTGPHDWSGSPNQSNTTYGPIYNPAAPPPSANYTQYPYDQNIGGPYYAEQQQPSVISSGGSGTGSQRVLRLAGSGSGSESDGKASTVVSEGNFRANMQQNGANLGAMGFQGPPAYQAHC